MITNSENETKEFAKNILYKINNTNIIALFGNLGSGKTVFVKGLAKELGIKENITSPTFVLIKEYIIKNPKPKTQISNKFSKLIHIDLYRLKKIDDLFLHQLQEYFNNKNNLVIIEWSERLEKNLPKDVLKIKFKYIDKNKRKIKI